NQILARFQKAALLLGFVVIAAILPTSVQAQETAAAPKSELKSSLGELSTLYQNEVQRLEKRVEEANALYKDGLISRVQFEGDEKALADARAKVDRLPEKLPSRINQRRRSRKMCSWLVRGRLRRGPQATAESTI